LKGIGEATLTVADINDNAPLFNQIRYEAEIKENLATNSKVLHVNAEDPDAVENGTVVYHILYSVSYNEMVIVFFSSLQPRVIKGYYRVFFLTQSP